MRLTIIHTETAFFAGAQRMLGYFIESAARRWQVTVALAPNPRMAALIPPTVRVIHLPANQQFSPMGMGRQLTTLLARTGDFPQVVHGWTARDWELTTAAGKVMGVACVGSLHDHPQAAFISPWRQRLMRTASLVGLDGVVCVSGAVREACLGAGYDASRLTVIRNGLPLVSPSSRVFGTPLKLGFIGAFSERKGLRALFAFIERWAEITPMAWELHLAGGAQDVASERMVADLRLQYQGRPWWAQVKWLGWVERPQEFFSALDLLICPSTDFDPFPTVLLEAGLAGVPALATDVGGVSEIIVDGETGWVMEPSVWSAAADRLALALQPTPDVLRIMGQRARLRIDQLFTVERMVADHAALYERLW